MSKRATVIPSASRLIGSLRDLGYESPEAVADLLDNSVAAGASRIDVLLSFDGDRSSIRIADNGVGMTSDEITEAMRYGASRTYADDDLGKFGLGLKTASMSQCRRLTIASRSADKGAAIQVRQLDLNYVEEHDSWDVLILDPDGCDERLTGPIEEAHGTVVLWEDLDRILTYKDPFGGWAEKRMLALAAELETHLGMVFHRFLDDSILDRELEIAINGNSIDPWDPFATDEASTVILPENDVLLATPGGSGGVVHLAPYVLPRKAEFSTLNQWQLASGPKNWNFQQGFYIYRANRLIQSGGWSGMRTPDEHTKLSRIALHFGPELDQAFDVNVAKMRVKLPSTLKDEIRQTVDDAVRAAKQTYDQKVGKPARGKPATGGKESPGRSDPVVPPIGTNGGASPNGAESGGVEGAAARREALERAANEVGKSKALSKIIEALNDKEPEVARELGW